MDIYNLQDYLRITNKYRDFGYVFRGVASKYFNVFETTIERASDDNQQFEKEFEVLYELFDNFKMLNIDKISIIQLARHYGFKSRFLDFSEDPLVSLYFVCKEKFDVDGKIIIFDKIEYTKRYNLIS